MGGDKAGLDSSDEDELERRRQDYLRIMLFEWNDHLNRNLSVIGRTLLRTPETLSTMKVSGGLGQKSKL